MKQILSISKWEIYRLLYRFGGRSRFIILVIVLLALVASYLVYHSGVIGGKELYTVGVTPGTPAIYEPSFRVLKVESEQGRTMLLERLVDAYIDNGTVYFRDDDRSRFVKDALLEYLSTQELLRISEEYETDRAFPLRVRVVLLERPEPGFGIGVTQETSPATGTDESQIAAEPVPAGGNADENSPEGYEIVETALEEQLETFDSGGLARLKETLLSERDVIIPSLSPPILPMAQVILVFSFVLPVLFIAVFFASSFAEERISRRLVVLLSTPVSPLQVITGKLLPYLAYSWIIIIVLTLVMGGRVFPSLAIYTPVILLIFSAYMIVALMYRSFRDLTLFSVLVISGIMVYLVVPALLTGVSSLSYISPLTLAVEMYRGETIGVPQYFLATTPLYLVFFQSIFIGTRVFNEEYLMGFKPFHRKITEAINLAVSRTHLNLSALLSSFFFIPVVFIMQLIAILFVQNIPAPASLWILVIISAMLEETAKSAVVFIALRDKSITTKAGVLRLSAISAAGFFIGEKLLLLLALSVLSESDFISAVFSGGLWFQPLLLHIASTCVIGLVTKTAGTRYYYLAILTGTIIHSVYNLFITGVIA